MTLPSVSDKHRNTNYSIKDEYINDDNKMLN
jgi:hypothetical protein